MPPVIDPSKCTACGKCAEICTEDVSAYEHALLQMKLGDSYLGAPLGGGTVPDASAATPEELGFALGSYKKALSIYGEEAYPAERACINFRLGGVYRSLAGAGDQKNNLKKAAESYSDSIKFYTPEDYSQAATS